MSFDIQKIVRENIAKLKAYSSARDEFEEATADMVFLDANENPFQNGVNRYPDPRQQSVKDLLSNLKGIPTNQILLGNGSDEVLDLIFRAFCEPKEDNVIFLPPTYGMYNVLSGLNNIATKEVLLSEDFDIRVEETLAVADAHSKILFLCSPNNPSGNAFSEEKIKAIVEGFHGIVVIDEAYVDFSAKESWLRNLVKYPNLIITQTLSKAFGMAGIRLGICYASVEIIEVLNRIKPPYNVNELTQQRAKQRLLAFDEVQVEIENILAERTKLIAALQTVNYISKIYPSDSNFVLVKVDDANKRYNQLLEKGIVIRNRTTQALCENTLRLTVGTSIENEKLIEALKTI
ncbi:histidinol-phosphate transaminase [Flavicella sediminum]|uniref:histidinol-phosphate transaminase n=1 Tax=Flavicella sediminum TaxID=2585141 RepID=UPI00111D8BEC|nr:histidinol-phosphate transaminase [Flavicella sediminum]